MVSIRISAALTIVTPIFLLLLLVVLSSDVHAATDPAGLIDTVLARYSATASTWSTVITARATWLFWTLALISMVWTFGLLALRKADLAEFYSEFFRFTIFTGFFWWLLTNGPRFAVDIMDGLRSVAGAASGTPPDPPPRRSAAPGRPSVLTPRRPRRRLMDPVPGGVP